MKNKIAKQMGKILSAVLAITIAGCLIHKEQKKNTSAVLSEVVKVPEKEGLLSTQEKLPMVQETSDVSVAESVAYAPVEKISITVQGTSYNVSSMTKEEFEPFIKTVNNDVKATMNYFHTSKAFVPRLNDDKYYLYVEKGNHKHVVNYGFLSEETWNEVFQDIKKFYRQANNQDYRCDETHKITYSKDMQEPISLLDLNDNKKIQDILAEIERERKAQMFSFSSSKSLSPPVEKHSYLFTFVRKGIKIDYVALLLEIGTWEEIQTEIKDCAISVSMESLYSIQP